jgi:hypothetical protein
VNWFQLMSSVSDSPAASGTSTAAAQTTVTNAGSQATPAVVTVSSGAAAAADSTSRVIVVSTIIVPASTAPSGTSASVSRVTATVPTGGAGQMAASKGVLGLALLVAGAVVAL